MKNFFCGISILLFVCILSASYYGTYRMTELRLEKEREEQALNLKSAGSGSSSEAVSGQARLEENSGQGVYCLKEKDGYVAVYKNDRAAVYEMTSIRVKSLPPKLQKEILSGKYLYSEEELYGFLENYST